MSVPLQDIIQRHENTKMSGTSNFRILQFSQMNKIKFEDKGYALCNWLSNTIYHLERLFVNNGT